MTAFSLTIPTSMMIETNPYRFFFFSSRRRHTRLQGDWSSDVCSSDLGALERTQPANSEKKVETLADFAGCKDQQRTARKEGCGGEDGRGLGRVRAGS